MSELVAFLAGAFSILSSGPQIVKIIITNKAEDLSLTTYIMLSIAGFLWIFYAIMENSNAILFWNAIGTLLALTVIFLKIFNKQCKAI